MSRNDDALRVAGEVQSICDAAERAFTEEEVRAALTALAKLSAVRPEPEASDAPPPGAVAHTIIRALLASKRIRFETERVATLWDAQRLEYAAALLRVDLRYALSHLAAADPTDGGASEAAGTQPQHGVQPAVAMAPAARDRLRAVAALAEEAIDCVLSSLHVDVMRLRAAGEG